MCRFGAERMEFSEELHMGSALRFAAIVNPDVKTLKLPRVPFYANAGADLEKPAARGRPQC